jgi:hypothetical protein
MKTTTIKHLFAFSFFIFHFSFLKHLVKSLHTPIDNHKGSPLCQDLTETIVMKFIYLPIQNFLTRFDKIKIQCITEFLTRFDKI